MPLALYALALGAFAVGTAEFIIAGLLPTLSADLGVDIPTTGLLVTGYALGVALGGPFLALLTARVSHRTIVIATVGLFALGQVGCAIAPSYPILLTVRVLCALTHGLFFGNASILARDLVRPERQGLALALMMAGVPAANLLGVPFGAVIGHALGWRTSFWLIGGLAALATLIILLTVPARPESHADEVGFRRQFKALARQDVILSYAAITIVLIGALTFGTFQVPFLIHVTGVPESATPPYLFAYGIGAIVGIFAGGRLADWRLVPSAIGTLIAAALAYGLVLLVMRSPLAMYVAMAGLGAVQYAFSSPLQTRVINGSVGAPTLAATFISTAFNLGYALGAFTGAGLLAFTGNYTLLPIVGTVLGLLAAAITFVSSRMERATRPLAAAPSQ